MQNLIARKIYKTKISAIKVVEEMDAGPIYVKEPLDLHGTAEEIFIRASNIVFEKMIPTILNEELTPKDQEGEPIKFKRRKPKDGDINNLKTLEEIHDYIRMLDAEGYPKAFLETDELKLEFTRASRKVGHIEADVKITIKEPE